MTDATTAQSDPQTQPEPPPLRWAVPVWAVLNSVLASLPLLALGKPELLIYSIMPALLLTLLLLIVPDSAARKISLFASIGLIIAATVSALAADSRPATVIAVALVMYLTSLPNKPAVAGLANLMALAFIVYTWTAAPVLAQADVAALGVAGITLAACAITFVAFATAIWLLGRLKPKQAEELNELRDAATAPETAPDGAPDASGDGIAAFLGPKNPMFRYAVVRALVYGTTLAVTFSLRGDQSGFWILLAMILVGQPTGRGSWSKAVERVIATLLGVLVFLAAFAFVPEEYLLILGLAIVLVGLAWIQRNSLIVTACATVFVIVLAGAAQSDYMTWALARLVDTAIGAGLGVLVSFAGETRRKA